jgi:hypothetical protein
MASRSKAGLDADGRVTNPADHEVARRTIVERSRALDTADTELADRYGPGRLGGLEEVDDADFSESTGENIRDALDLETWRPGEDLAGVFERLDREVADAVRQEDAIRRHVREQVFPAIEARRPILPQAGVYCATPEHIRRTQCAVLFNGGVEACDGTVSVHDTLPLTIMQIGVCLVSYNGEQGSWVQRLFRRDLRSRGKDPVDEALSILERRQERAGQDLGRRKDALNELMRRGIMSWAERAVLTDKTNAPWRMGHGHPAPYELITGSGSKELLDRSLATIERLVLDHQRFVFVPSAPAERALLTIGNALRPLEFAVIETAERQMKNTIFEGKYWPDKVKRVQEFYQEVAPNIVIGVYRTSNGTPPYLFYAHPDHVEQAALIAMADSVLQAHRGFPILIDIADTVCKSTFGTDGFTATVQASYAATGHPVSYLGERETRR